MSWFARKSDDIQRNYATGANRGAYNARIRQNHVDFGENSNNAGLSRRAKLAASEVKSALLDKSGELKLGRKHRPDYVILILILTLAVIGLVVLFSIAPALNSGNNGATTGFMARQIALITLGIIIFFVVSRVPLDFWRKYSSRLFLGALILCVAVAIPHFPLAINANGAQRWFNLGAIGTFQPAEFLKFGMLLFASSFLAVRSAQNRLNSWRELLPFFALFAAALFTVAILQKDMGTALAMFAIVLVQLIISGLPGRKIALVLAVSAIAGVLAITMFSHRTARITTFLGGGSSTSNYQINQSLIAIGSGGLFGRGLGQSVQAFGWLPEQSTDSIFAILGETLGWIGLVVVIGLFGILLKRIIAKVDYTENLFLRLILAGVFGWLAAHVMLNIGAMTSLIPLTGVTLPLISFGGTSMVFIMAALGLVFAISGYTMHRKIEREPNNVKVAVSRHLGARL
ncbi:MAG: putative peptidoglycan glycosyltransferase FtsW [Candidatus Nanoperiomorbaceae bacterium]